MNIWIIFVGETLPMDEATRMWRYGILAETLSARGHQVTRWAPTFNHAHKKQRYHTDHTYKVNKNYSIKLIFNKTFNRLNISSMQCHIFKIVVCKSNTTICKWNYSCSIIICHRSK